MKRNGQHLIHEFSRFADICGRRAKRLARCLAFSQCMMAAVIAFSLLAPSARAFDTVLHNFAGAGGDGAYSYSSLVSDRFGNLYGTTSQGGTHNLGTVFVLCAPLPAGAADIAPCVAGSAIWVNFVLYNFTGFPDGANPYSTLIFGGNYAGRAFTLYGTTYNGGNPNSCQGQGCGTVFELCAPAAFGGCGGAGWVQHVLYSFMGGKDGSNPFAGVIADKANNLYGTTVYGGALGTCLNSSGANVFCGTVFKLKKGAGWVFTEQIMHRFSGAPGDGANPFGALCCNSIFAIPTLYGTTVIGGTSNAGIVFKVKNAGVFPETILHSFTGGPDGGNPYGNVIFDAGNNLYSTTAYGGANGAGTVFRLNAPPLTVEAVLYNFCSVAGCADGANPTDGLLLDAAGDLFGTTIYGGIPGSCGGPGCGTVFKLLPPAGPEFVLHSFAGGPGDGSFPWGGVIPDATFPGELYGTTVTGGAIGGFGIGYSVP